MSQSVALAVAQPELGVPLLVFGHRKAALGAALVVAALLLIVAALVVAAVAKRSAAKTAGWMMLSVFGLLVGSAGAARVRSARTG